MSSPYNLSETEEGYQFTTDSGLTYFLYFTEYYLKDNNDNDIIVPSFGFFCTPRNNGRTKYDGKIKNTILSVIADFFEKNEDIGLLYLCDNQDGKARHRRITFSKWHKASTLLIEKFDSAKIYSKADFYTALLVRPDNPKKDYYVEAFYKHLNEYFTENISQNEPTLSN